MHLGGLSIDYFCHPCKLPYLCALWECCSHPFEIFQEHRISQTEDIWKKYLLKGVMKVVCLALSSSKGVCQNPVAASNSENVYLNQPAWEVYHLEWVRCIFYLFIFLLRWFRPTHILTPSFFLGTGTLDAHCSVGSVISSIISRLTFHCSSSCELELLEFGAAPCLSLIFTGIVLKSPTGSQGGLDTSFTLYKTHGHRHWSAQLQGPQQHVCWNSTSSLCNKWRFWIYLCL